MGRGLPLGLRRRLAAVLGSGTLQQQAVGLLHDGRIGRS